MGKLHRRDAGATAAAPETLRAPDGQPRSAGVLAPGERVRELHYAARCAVSRTPVREAIALLLRRKALETNGRRGAWIRIGRTQARGLLKAAPFATDGESRSGSARLAFVEAANRLRVMLGDSRAFPRPILKDAAVARALKVSRTTANRALALLARENLLEPLPRRGWKRVRLEPREFLDWYDFRLAVEPAALRSAWPRLDLGALRALAERTRKAATSRGAKALSTAQRVALDVELHHRILLACSNRFLKRAMEEQESLRFIAVSPTWRLPHRAEQTFQEHTPILNAILAGRRAAAERALRRHLAHARAHLARCLRVLETKKGAR
ncbi:MAG: GntR family transcriptional regulator [Planctomycetes bacterium]|nr:GntR family transcriptional regulator [Planctomycetota bacterium]